MRAKDIRTFAWLSSIVMFIPVWIGVLYLVSAGTAALESGFNMALPGWLKGTVNFLTIPAVLLPVSYAVANRADRAVGSTQATSASWEHQGNHSAAERR